MLDAGDALPTCSTSRAPTSPVTGRTKSRAPWRVWTSWSAAPWLREEAERVPIKSPLDGNDLMELFGREPGAWIRPIKDHLLNLVIDGALAPDDREGAIVEAKKVMAHLEGD